MAANPQSDPFAAYQQPADPFAAYQKPMLAAPPPGRPTGVTIQAHTPTLLERVRGVAANSAIGHSLESTLPGVADALGLHPTETVNSPTYEADKGQILAPQYLLPDPTSAAGHLAHGVLTGAGQLTSGKNLATGAAIAAGAGLAAPLAAGAGGAAAVARAAGAGVRAGMAATGARGVYQDAKHAIQRANAGDTSGALEEAGAALPNAALTLPALGEPIEALGNAAQRGGVGLINETIGARTKDFKRGADPGTGYFQAGLGPSASMQSIADKATAANEATGQAIGDTSRTFQANGGLIPYEQGHAPIADAIAQTRATLTGPGGTGSTAALDAYDSTWDAFHQQAQQRGGYLPEDYAAAKRRTAANTTWNDPTQVGMTQMRQQTVGGMGGALVDAMPELGDLNSQYQNTLKLANRAGERAQTGQMPLSQIAKRGVTGVVGAGAGAFTHNPYVAAASGLGSMVLDSVPVKTGTASALYYGGKGLSAAGRGLAAIPSLLSRSVDEQGFAGQPNGGDDTGDYQPFNYAAQSNPTSAPYSRTGLAPEIIRPDPTRLGATGMSGMFARVPRLLPAPAADPDFSYSRQGITPEVIDPSAQSRSIFGLGADGRGGVLRRPLAMLPASVATPQTGLHADSDTLPIYAAPQRVDSSALYGSGLPSQQIEGHDGNPTTLYTPTAQIPARYRVVESNSIQTSHNPNTFAKNPNYPDIQARDYQQPEAKNRVVYQGQNFQPDLVLSDDPTGTSGPTVLDASGNAIGGNSRAMSLARHYASGSTAYKDALIAKAPSFGLDPEAIKAMDRPALVKQIINPQGGVAGLRALSADLNRPLTGSLAPSERAVSMGQALSPDTLHAVQAHLDDMGEGSSLRDILADPVRAQTILRRFEADGALTPQERPSFIDTSTGGLSPEGKNNVERALLGAAVGRPDLLDAAPKSVLAKLTSSLGPLASVAGRTDTWHDVLPALQRALEAHADMASKGLGIDTYLNQRGLLGGNLDPVEEAMTRKLSESPTSVRRALSGYSADARYAIPGQTSFLGPTPEQSFWHHFGNDPKQQDATPAAPVVRLTPGSTNAPNVSTLLGRPGLRLAADPSMPIQARALIPSLNRGLIARGNNA